MSEQGEGRLYPAVRTITSDVADFKSRLVQRGISMLSESELLELSVMGLDAHDKSIFIRAHGADGDDLIASYQDKDWWITHREVMMFEFWVSGTFIKCIRLPLMQLIPRGLEKVEGRTAGELSFGDKYIHYYERFETTQFSRPVRIDYLFSFSGEVLAIWCNEHFAHDYRPSGYPPIPHPSAMMPDCLLENLMIRVVSEMHYQPSTGEQVEESKKERIYFSTVEEYIDAVKSADVHMDKREMGEKEVVEYKDMTPPHNSVIVDFPVPDHFVDYGRWFRQGWSSSINDR